MIVSQTNLKIFETKVVLLSINVIIYSFIDILVDFTLFSAEFFYSV